MGNNYTTHGPNSPINMASETRNDSERAFQDLIGATRVMQAQISGVHRRTIDEFLDAATSAGRTERHRFRAMLMRVRDVAVLAGQVGVPVLDAINKLMELHLL
jgi:hypothetical protein